MHHSTKAVAERDERPHVGGQSGSALGWVERRLLDVPGYTFRVWVTNRPEDALTRHPVRLILRDGIRHRRKISGSAWGRA